MACGRNFWCGIAALAVALSVAASRGGAGQGEGRRIPGQLVAAVFRRASTAATSRKQNIEPEMVKLIGGPPNVAAMITNQIEASAVLVTIEGMNANLKKPGVAMYIGVHSQNKSLADGAVRGPQRPRRRRRSRTSRA